MVPFGPARRAVYLSLLAVAPFSGGCSDPLDTVSAYANERFLCTEEKAEEWLDLIARCDTAYLADGSCAGVASFTGVLQGHPYVVESLLDDSSVQDVAIDGTLLRDVVRVFGASPYFSFRFSVEGFGGDVLAPGAPAEQRTLSVVSREGPTPLYDEETTVDLRINTRGASLELASRSGELIVNQQTTELQDFRISAELSQGGTLEGCFHGLTRSYSVSMSPNE
jgi:hypothetical protein